MINISLYLGYIAATFVLLAIPGPNIMMILAKSTCCGTRAGLLTVVGMTVAQAIQILIVVLGLSWIVNAYPYAFEIVKLGGAAYLIYLGVRYWLGSSKLESLKRSADHCFQTGFYVGISNPKSLLFMAAFFPQFIDKAYAPDPQLFLLGITYIVMAILLDVSLSLLAGTARPLLAAPSTQAIIDKVTGAVLVCAGLLLVFLG
ncbi:LysE family translocator [Pseudovibrio sp. Tun.PSC04-5.I4]|uniref:LysE family translocator n=1 Tax=Pseudovibrio sp. Tun.PSC04-5.I4 TaxID=1798213 RepID=UPI000881B4FC|nr:LysE family translocator [Pseudovibrio sp. Tun.PSC04-5.I4]SDQ79689.1 LysE type translocator [Pseudovibrio sp. Tun.PSC04-5.I4]